MPGGPDITPFFWLLLIASIVAMVGQYVRIPYALALVITGLVIGAPHLVQVHLEPHTLFTLFLPPLLFEAGINIRADMLRRDWRPIAAYSLVGTIISALVVGGLSSVLLHLPILIALVFGAMIAPTDPISVIALFRRLGIGRRLSLLVEAESLFNDGVAVVLFSVLTGIVWGRNATFAGAVINFVAVVAGGAAVGLGIGTLASRLTRHFDDHLLEITLTTIVAFGSYLGAEALHVSGVIAVVAAALTVGNYGMDIGMSPTTRLAVSSFWEYAAFVVNSIVFLLIGIEVTVVNLWSMGLPVLGAIGIVLIGRAVPVYGLSPLLNRFEARIPLPWQHVLFWGGLRGALPMALVLGLGDQFPHRDLLAVLTFGVVLFSLLVQGMTVESLLRQLKIVGADEHESVYRRLVAQLRGSRAALDELEGLSESRAIPEQVCTELAEQYRERIRRAEDALAALYQSDRLLRQTQTGEARRRALLAEKGALYDARREGLLDDGDFRQLVERVNDQLVEQLPRLSPEHPPARLEDDETM